MEGAARAAIDVDPESPIFFKCRPPSVWWKPFARRQMADVRPRHVADAIDRYLARNPIGTRSATR